MKRPIRRGWTVQPLLAAALWLAPPAGASAAGDCAPDPTDAAVTVAAVADDLDLALADGRSLRLAGIDGPRATAATPDLPARARRALEDWLAAGPVALRALSPTPDRWGRVPALLFRASAASGPAAVDAQPSAAAALVGAGFARARPDALAHACFPALLALEDAARLGRRGLWADPHYAVLDAGDAAGLADQAGGMALVEGVLHVHEARGGTPGAAGPGTLYLALGRDRWGFSAALSRRDALRFSKSGLDVRDYDGTPVRLRGDLDGRFGPRLRLADPDGFESLEPGSAGLDKQKAPGSAGLDKQKAPGSAGLDKQKAPGSAGAGGAETPAAGDGDGAAPARSTGR